MIVNQVVLLKHAHVIFKVLWELWIYIIRKNSGFLKDMFVCKEWVISYIKVMVLENEELGDQYEYLYILNKSYFKGIPSNNIYCYSQY